MSFFVWVNKKVLGMALDIAAEVGEILNERLNPFEGATRSNAELKEVGFNRAKKLYRGAVSEQDIRDMVASKDFKGGSGDQNQMRAQGMLQYMLKEFKKQQSDSNKAILNAKAEFKSKNKNIKYVHRLDVDKALKSSSSDQDVNSNKIGSAVLQQLDKINKNNKNNTTVQVRQADDFLTDLLGGGKALLQGGLNGFDMTLFNPADQIMAGMSGGPIDAAIRDSGDMAAEVYSLIAGMVSPAASGNTQGAGQVKHVDKIELSVNLDGEMIAKQCVKANIVAFAKDRNLGGSYDTLGDGTTRNSSFGSTEGSSV